MIPIINTRAYELVRDRIAEILANELPSQSALHGKPELNAPVFVNRIVPLSGQALPLVNVLLGSGNWDNFSSFKQDGTYVYNIDIYVSSSESDTESGDVLSMRKLENLAGVIQGIFSHPQYNTLSFAKPFIQHTEVRSLSMGIPTNTLDVNNTTQARLEFLVRVPETESSVIPTNVDSWSTQVKLGLTDFGYIYSGGDIPIPDPVCEVNTFVYNSDSTQLANKLVNANDNTIILPNIDFTDSDNVTTSVPTGVDIVATICEPRYGGVVIQDGLKLDLDSSNINSYSGTGSDWLNLATNTDNATIYNNPPYSNGFNGLLKYDGVQHYAISPTHEIDITKKFTIQCMVYLDTTVATALPVIASFKTSGTRPITILLGYAGSYQGVCITGGGNIDSPNANTNIQLSKGEWHNILLEYDGVDLMQISSFKVYVENVNIPLTSSGQLSISGNVTTIGRNGNSASFYWKGYEPRILHYEDKILTAAEKLHNATILNAQYNNLA